MKRQSGISTERDKKINYKSSAFSPDKKMNKKDFIKWYYSFDKEQLKEYKNKITKGANYESGRFKSVV